MKNVLIVIAAIVGFFFVLGLFWRLLGLLTLLSWVIAFVVFWGVVAYVCYLIFFKKKAQAVVSEISKSFKLYDPHKSSVLLFRSPPTIQDLALLNDELHVTKLELNGQAFRVDNDTKVVILDEKDAQSVKVKIAGKDAKERVGWVHRSSVVSETKQLPHK
ncbi:MAG TPA: hypothetical protein V6D17_14395 [Candidatus Obscuribacterales bacterium]